MNIPWVCDFSELDKSKLSWVGGKGANLGEMTQQGFPVPAGFCVTTSAYHSFLEQGERGRMGSFFATLQQLDVEDIAAVRKIGAEIREYHRTLPMPEEVEKAVVEYWKRAGTEHSYAVRSSATAEDLPDASFAGQQDTYLNIRGEDALVEHVRMCWASLFTDRAIVYRTQNRFDHKEVALAVVVQRMILPEVSGVMFTADPLSENRQIISIDASFGLGEALVSGKVTPDLYRVDKRNNEVVEANISEKDMAIRALPGGGTFEEELPDDLRHARVLSDEQVKELAALGKRIEDHYGSPQDIEWCLEGDTFSIVQSRPVTSLYPGFEFEHIDDTRQIYMCFHHLQVMTEAISPMGQSCWSTVLPFGKWNEPVSTVNPYMNRAGGRIYLNVTKILRNKRTRAAMLGVLTIAEHLISLSLDKVVKEPEFLEEAKTGKKISLPWVARNIGFPVLRRVIGFLFFQNTQSVVTQRTQFIDDLDASMRSEIAALGIDRTARLRHMIQRMGRLFQEQLAFNFIPVIVSGLLSVRLVARLTGKTMEDPDVSELMRAYEGNVTTDMDLLVGDLADVARAHPAVMQYLREQPVSEALDTLPNIEGGTAFLDALQSFLDTYGMRGASEVDIARARWNQDSTPLLQMIIGNLAEAEPGAHRKQHRELALKAEEARDRLIAAADVGFWGWLKKRLVRRWTRVHRDLMGVREHPKFMLIRTFGIAKEILLEEADSFVASGELEYRDDIFHLRWEEVLAAVEGKWSELHPKLSMAQLATRRKSDSQRYDDIFPPRVLTSDGEIVRAELTLENAPVGALIGSSASAGIIEGRARIILSPTDAVLQHGEILVAPFTDPGWTPLFIQAAGLVMEVGGLMTHGSVVAREYGLPAVVCVQNATQKIKTGQWIRVDGDRGFVEILEDPESENTVSAETSEDRKEANV